MQSVCSTPSAPRSTFQPEDFGTQQPDGRPQRQQVAYFTIKADTSQNQTTTVTTYTTTLNQVPVGFVMNVTPQISSDGQILLNVRPNISRIVGTVDDPNPALKLAGVTSPIPVIRTREMESVLRIQNGNIAVMGGLMEDTLQNKDSAVPGLGQIPVIGELFHATQ